MPKPKSSKGGKFSLGSTGAHDATEILREVDAEFLVSAIVGVLAAGCAVTFSRTRDGGSVAITILDDGHKERAYCATGDELMAICEALVLQSEIVTDQD